MWRLLFLAALRYHVRQPWQLGLALAGIALGVAAFVGIQTANQSANNAFELSSDALRGATTHRVVPVGTDLLSAVYEDLVLAGYGQHASPVIEMRAQIESDARTDMPVRLIGVDPIAELRFARYFPAPDPDRGIDSPGATMLRLIAEPGAALISTGTIPGLDPAPGDRLRLASGSTTIDVAVIGSLGGRPDGTLPGAVILVDVGFLATARGQTSLSWIDLALEDDEIEAVRAMLPDGSALVDATNRDSELAGMTRAFTTNLTALGLLALVVGLFLIHATMSFSVVRRRAHIATLRGLGVSRRELVGSIAMEAFVIGAVAGGAGAVLGSVLADALINLVLRTMSDLAFSRAIANTPQPLWVIPAGIALGALTTLVAAVAPAREAAGLAPAAAEQRSALEARSRSASVWLAAAALPVALAAAVILAAWPRNLAGGFAALFLILISGAMCTPAVTRLLMTAIEPLVRRTTGLTGVLAVRSVTASLSRTGVATAALAVAVATVISIGLMIGSFRDGLEQWIDNTLTADFYVLLNGRQADRGRAEAWAQAIAVLPEVAAISRTVRVSLPGVDGDIGLRAYEEGPSGWGLDLVAGAAVEWEQRFRTGDGIVLAEPYAYRQALRVGDSLRLPTPAGPNEFDIVAIARDYNTAGSAVIMSFDGFRQYWPAPTVSGLGVHLAPDADASSAGAAIEDARPTQLNAIVRSTRAIRTLSLTLFDRTFEITSVLRALAGIVAFFGVLSAVLALQLERRAEFSVLRAVGMSMSELKQHVIIQTTLLGLAAATAAIPLGIALAWLLILVINRRAFGWSMEFVASGEPLSYGVALAILGAGLSGLAAAAIGFRSRSAESFRG